MNFFKKDILQVASGYRSGHKTSGQCMVSYNANRDSLRPLQGGSATALPAYMMQQHHVQAGSPYLL